MLEASPLEIEICVGSSCHLKGTYEVVKAMENYIESNRLTDDIKLKGSFCLGHCTEGVSVRMDGKLISLSPVNAEEALKEVWEERRNAADQL